jgi:ABC-type transporter Mla MlaB component
LPLSYWWWPRWPPLSFGSTSPELKANGNKLTPTQSETMADMTAAGATVAWALGLDVALAQLEQWGPLRGRAAWPLYFRFALSHARPVIIDLSQLRFVDARFIGVLLMLRKVLKGQGAVLKFFGASKAVQRLFRLNGVQYLLAEH